MGAGGLRLHSPQLGESKHLEPEFQMARQWVPVDSYFTVHNSVRQNKWEWFQEKNCIKCTVQVIFEKCTSLLPGRPQSECLNVFETTIRFVGGLLSAYSFTGDTMFRYDVYKVFGIVQNLFFNSIIDPH